MGLCKCAKKKVTTQFCFEHRVNVCEYCMVFSHSKCVIQSYLQWLQDSDYNPICQLCGSSLESDECVRLVCYHVFHWSCLNRHAEQLPPNTAPAGYACPTCQADIFPPNVMVSPVVDRLRALLSQANWARPGLGLPLVDEDPMSVRYGPEGGSEEPQSGPEDAVKDWRQAAQKGTHSLVDMDSYAASVTNPHYSSGDIVSPLLPKFNVRDSEHFGNVSYDHDENKYRRRSPLEWFSRWLKLVKPGVRRDPHQKTKRCVMVAVLCLIGLVTLIALMIRAGRMAADQDPFLDPMANPNIHVEDSGGAAAIERVQN